ncbi:MAG TPA: hypothetical protein VGC79_29970 [Polyangiaceae bacterium]
MPWPVRGRAASLCRTLAFEVAEDDTLALRATETASTCAESFPVAHDLLVAAREVAVDPATPLEPILALCRRAHALGHHGTVVVALLELLEVDGFHGDVPAAWLVSAHSVDGEGDYWLRRLVRRWVELHGANHEGVRAVVRNRAELWFPTRRFRLDVLRAMHIAEPTAAGWVALAGRRAELGSGPLGLTFGERHAAAVAALREAFSGRAP